jgi:hypothetical protein
MCYLTWSQVLTDINREDMQYTLINKEALAVLLLMCEFAQICLLISVNSDEQEKQTKQQLQTLLIDAASSMPNPLLEHVRRHYLLIKQL